MSKSTKLGYPKYKNKKRERERQTEREQERDREREHTYIPPCILSTVFEDWVKDAEVTLSM